MLLSSNERAMCDSLLRVAADGERLFATVDLAALQSQAAPTLKWFRRFNPICLFGDLRAEAELASPWLVEVATGGENEVLEKTVWLAHRHSAVTWISSPLAAPELALQLRRRTEARLPDGDLVLLRFFDPRVLEALSQVLQDDEHRTFFDVGAAWCARSRLGSLLTIRAERASSRPREFRTPLQLSQEQFSRLLKAAEIDTVMPELVQRISERFLAMSPTERVTFTQHWLARADELGIEQYPERVALCVLAGCLEPGFDARAPWRALLDEVREKVITLKQAVAQAVEQGE